MPLTPLNFGASANPIDVPTTTEMQQLLPCGPLDLGLLNGLLKTLADRINAVDAADNAIASASYNATTNNLTLTMADAAPVIINMSSLIADTLITSSSYNATTNTLTLTTANGDPINIDMSTVISDAVATALAAGGTPQFGIIMWLMANGPIPTGWAAMDGTDGRPDWRDKFIIGASGAYPSGSTGGAATATIDQHALTVAEIPSHSHNLVSAGISNSGIGSGGIAQERTVGGDTKYILSGSNGPATLGDSSSVGDGDGHTHTMPINSNLPPFYAAVYIMRL
jgi:microcystin-dependent protein